MLGAKVEVSPVHESAKNHGQSAMNSVLWGRRISEVARNS